MFEFIVLALIVYYLRMAGYHRLRVAVGGINLGLVGFMTLLLYLTETGLVPLVIPSPIFYASIFILSVYALAGILNLITKVR